MAMDPPAAAAATTSQQPPSPPGFLTFLKHGAVLPARNAALFAPLLVLTAALAAALLLGNALSVQPLAAAVLLDADAISRVDPATAAYRDLVRALQSDLKRLLFAVGGCLLGAVVAGSAIKIATVFAAVAAFSSTDRRATVGAALGAAKGNVWGPVLTVAFGYVLELACAAAIVALAVLAVVLLDYSLLLLFLDALLALLAALFLVYLTVVCAVAVAVSAAEPRCPPCTRSRSAGGPAAPPPGWPRASPTCCCWAPWRCSRSPPSPPTTSSAGRAWRKWRRSWRAIGTSSCPMAMGRMKPPTSDQIIFLFGKFFQRLYLRLV